LGDFIETKAKKSPTSPGLVSPDVRQTFVITDFCICSFFVFVVKFHFSIIIGGVLVKVGANIGNIVIKIIVATRTTFIG
jgi:hypothetical protein